MTEKHDSEAYLGNINLKASGVETQFTKEQMKVITTGTMILFGVARVHMIEKLVS